MNFIDTHTHLYLSDFDVDRKEVMERARKNHVSKIFLPNIDSSTLPLIYKMADDYPESCFPMAGLHPTSVKNNYKKELQIVEQQLKNREVAGIGEIGIDLYRDQTYRDEQIKAFRHQVHLASNHMLPVIIHSRNSFDEIFSVLDEFPSHSLHGIFHSFTGTYEQARRAIDLGFLLGINGIVTFKNSGLDIVVKKLGPQYLVLETDAPYLAPVPKRGKRNESSFLLYIADKLSEIFSVKTEEVAKITTKNAMNVFHLKQ